MSKYALLVSDECRRIAVLYVYVPNSAALLCISMLGPGIGVGIALSFVSNVTCDYSLDRIFLKPLLVAFGSFDSDDDPSSSKLSP
jgi:hypothetical protein